MRFLLSVLLACLFSAATGQRLPQSFAEQLRLLPQENDTHALARLDSLQHTENGAQNGPLRRLLQTLGAHYRDINERQPGTETERQLLAALSDHDRHDEREAQTLARVYLAAYYWKQRNPKRAFEMGLKAYNAYHSWSDADFPVKHQALYELASRFYYFRDFDNARRLLNEALQCRQGFAIPENFNLLNTLGLCFRETGQYDSATFYLKAAYREAEAAQLPVWQGITSGNLGISAYLQGRFSEARPLLQRDIALSEQSGQAFDNRVKSMAILGDIERSEGNAAAARALLEGAYGIMLQKNFTHRPELVTEVYPRLARLRQEGGNLASAITLLQAADAARDSLQQQRNALVLAGAQLQVETERQAADQQVLEGERRLARQTRNGLLAGILLLAVIALLIIRQQQVRHRYRQQEAERRRQAAEAELAEAGRQLDHFTAALHEKNRLIEQFHQELSARADENEQARGQLRQLTILTEAEWDHFRVLFEKVHAGFLARLHRKLPDLSPAETRFLVLAKLAFTNREIAAILGIGDTAVRVTRSRLRKKLGLPEEQVIEELIAQI